MTLHGYGSVSSHNVHTAPRDKPGEGLTLRTDWSQLFYRSHRPQVRFLHQTFPVCGTP